jgi:hypothetical protein
MADFAISGRMKIKTLKANFKNEFGSTLRVYKGVKFADDNDTIASIASKKIESGSELKANGNTKVGTFEDRMKDIFGIKVQVATKDDSALVDNDLTLTASGK